MKTIAKYQLRLVREEGPGYQLDGERVTCPASAVKLLCRALDMDIRIQEIFAILTLDIKNQVTGIMEVSTGGLSTTLVEPRAVFQRAILQNAAAIILAHNHPSGIPEPSLDDLNITHRLVEAGKLLGIDVLDHLIIGDRETRYHSMKEHGEL